MLCFIHYYIHLKYERKSLLSMGSKITNKNGKKKLYICKNKKF